MTNNNVYSLDLRKEYLGGDVIPVTVQGVCSYTVYAGPNAESVVQLRLKTQQLKMETAHLASAIYGEYAPDVDFKRYQTCLNLCGIT